MKKKTTPAKNARKKTAQKPLHKKVYHATPPFVRGAIIGTALGIAIVVLQGAPAAHALSINAPRDCDPNSVINCGSLTTGELQQDYGQSGVAAIFSYFGISKAEVDAMGSTAVAGTVYKDGTVKVGGKIVATNAVTAGRLNISGSTRVTSGGVTFYKRTPSVSFVSSSLAAFVVMKNGQFSFAVLASCGNPVAAKPVVIKTPPKTTTPPPTPTPTPPEQPPVTTVSAARPTAVQPAQLPQTGPKEIITVAILAILGGTSFHMLHRHIRRKRHARRHAAAHHAAH